MTAAAPATAGGAAPTEDNDGPKFCDNCGDAIDY